MPKRNTDKDDLIRFQTDRVFTSNGLWYFNTREGYEVGPYDTRDAAEAYCGLLVKRLRELQDAESIRTAIKNFIFDTTDYSPNFNPTQFIDYVAND